MVSQKKIESAVEKASKAFWIAVQAEFPELEPDNLDHGTVIVLQWQMKDAIERYLLTGEKEDGEANGQS